MSNPYVDREIKKVLESAEFPKNMALASAWIIAHFKGVNIKIFDVSDTSSLCDYNIIASTENTTQAKAIIDEIQAQMKRNLGTKINSVEGVTDGEWILVDMLDCIVHIFQETSRDIFDLESLWQDSPQVQIPNEYYFGATEEIKEKTDPTENYF